MIWLIPIFIVALGSLIIHQVYPETSIGGLLVGFIVALLSLIPVAVVVCLLIFAAGPGGSGPVLVYVAGALGIIFSIWVWIAIARKSSRRPRDNSSNT
jgi:hypothetical protein